MSDEVQEIVDRLDSLKNSLQETEVDIVKKTKERDTTKTDIADLEKKLNEINQVKAAYEKVYDGLYEEVKGFVDYAATKRKIIDGALQESDKEQINTKIENVDKTINDNKNVVKKLEGDYEKAKTKFETTKRELAAKQNNFDYFKIYQNEIRDKLKILKGFKDLIEKEPEDNFRNIYFWISEFNKVEIKLRDKDTFISDYINSEKELNEVKLNCRNNEEAMNEAKNKLDSSQKNLDSLIKDRNDNILKEISTINSNGSQKGLNSVNNGPNKNISSENSDNKK
ncbi:hypothetical protein [Methanosarcina sp. WWM596]|uniref:hypothetical protein n=1 Tax=Methanosarcina sp. WWM596 TaxID=1434103 RepID=UPI00061612AD|nr:hypothetical protein [Methanosarcina sp. WWM596]AKB18661.1 hypothetical protein MSWHS_1798 [Methanosarcina sp. WWM596]